MYRRIYKKLYEGLYCSIGEKKDLAKLGVNFLNDEIEKMNKEDRQEDRWWTNVSELHQETLAKYDKYVEEREKGSSRMLFPHIQAAKWFLLQSCPTKMVDGVWLSTIDACSLFRKKEHGQCVKDLLVRTFFEECGEGSHDLNHVVLFKKLFESSFEEFSLDTPSDWIEETLIQDSSFRAGAIQMALAAACSSVSRKNDGVDIVLGGEEEEEEVSYARTFLPELVGYNLSYEQLAFHMLVTIVELRELSLDPCYFALHVTVDNAHTGHAAMAMKCCKLLMKDCRDETERKLVDAKIQAGFRASGIGVSVIELMQDYTIEKHLDAILKSKLPVASGLHSRVKVLWKGAKCSLSSVMDHCSENDTSLLQAIRSVHRERSLYLATRPGRCMYRSFDADEMEVLEMVLG
jgi:hypothetical protein